MPEDMAQNPGHPFFNVDVATVSADRQYVVLRMCERCDFYKNAGMSAGQRCRRAGCDGTIREYHYFLAES